jgi:hypothetical protein
MVSSPFSHHPTLAQVGISRLTELIAPLTQLEALELLALENKLNVEVQLQTEIAASVSLQIERS